MHDDGRHLHAAVEPQRHDSNGVVSRPPQRRGVDEHGLGERLPGRHIQHSCDGDRPHMRKWAGRRGRRGLVFAGIAISACAVAGGAFAFWACSDSSNPAAAVADSIQTGNTPTLGAINGQDVTLNWTATTTASGASVSGYTVNRYSVSSGGTPTAATGGCSGTVAALTCTEQSAPAGTWYYAVTPEISLWTGAESSRRSAT